MEIKFQRQDFKRAVDKVKALGYRVFVSIWSDTAVCGVTYVHVVNDKGQVGYMQQGEWCGCTFSTVHKPCRQWGTGFGLDDTWNPIVAEAITNDIIDRSFAIAPSWARGGSVGSIKKYTLESWIEYHKKFCKDIIEY